MGSASFDPNIARLRQLASQAERSRKEADKGLSALKGRSVTRLESQSEELPSWAFKAIEVQKELEDAVHAMEAKGLRNQIPKDVFKTLKKSKATVRKLANKVNYSAFLKAIRTQAALSADTTKLLTPLESEEFEPSLSNMREWELNCGLLYSAYQHTENEDTKAIIRFLMINYLAKAAYLNEASGTTQTEEEQQSYQEMLQLGQFTLGGMYHRTMDVMVPTLYLLDPLDEQIGSANEGAHDLIIMDHMEIQQLFNVSFVPTPDISNEDAVVAILVEQFEAHLDRFPDENMQHPVLIDITAQIGQKLITGGQPEKIHEYEEAQREVKKQINAIVKRAVEALQLKYPEREDIKSKAADYIKMNLAIVSRAEINDRVAVLGMHANIFDSTDFMATQAKPTSPHPFRERHFMLSDKLKEWAGQTGVNVGAVNLRRIAAEIYVNPLELRRLGRGQITEYAVPGRTDLMMYSKPSSVAETHVFNTLAEMGEGKNPNASAGQVLLTRATVTMMRTLLGKIDTTTWMSKQDDPTIRELTQTACFRTLQHLATAMNHIDDFRQFSQAIDRTHAELTTLLVLYSPFDPASFEVAYEAFLRPIFPTGMRPTTVGVARSAMNVFAGVNSLILQSNPNAVRICAPHSYYEEEELLEGTGTLQQALEDPGIEKIDLYATEFYHNIDVDPNYTHYQKGRVIADIQEIFRRKPKTDALTVAIDATIDFTRSDDIKELLKTFENEIKEGRLNIVVFRSGQKFDMLGLDNYYGNPFYIVNNGREKWGDFNRIKTDDAFHTDELSVQYFSWMAEAGFEIVEQYKQPIFDNTRSILDNVPQGLLPAPGKSVCISTFEEGVKTPFIDIKIDFPNPETSFELQGWVREHFIELFLSENKLVYARGSFGFVHPNITWIDPKMRINPGIDPTDIPLYQRFFQDLEAKVSEIQG